MNKEKCALKWKHLISNLSSSLSDVFTENSYSDVTLVGDDLIPFQAHKFILSALSPVLKNILLDNPHSHPLIYLRGVKHQELESILQFIYLGEISVYPGNMNRFIETAKDLQIKKLAETVITGNAEPLVDFDIDSGNGIISTQDMLADSDDAGYGNNGRSISSIADEIMNLDILEHNPGSDELGSDEQLYKCEECEATYKSKGGLFLHTRSKHESIVYSCKQCSYKAKYRASLKTHQQSDHEGVLYACTCDQCEYQTKTERSMKRHQRSIHKGVTYSCNQCEHLATQPRDLKRHQQAVHEGMKYSCDQCEYQTGWKHHLKTHKSKSHSLLEH